MAARQARVSDLERTYTVAEFEKLPTSYERFELLEGKLVEKPVAKYEHSWIGEIIKRAVLKADPDEKIGRMLSEVSVFIWDDYSPTPDLSFWVAERVPPRKVLTAPRPDLAVEIQSPGQGIETLILKAREYIRVGVALVWLIQPATQVVLVFRQGQIEPETLTVSGELGGEAVIANFRLPVQKLFED